MDRNPFSDSAIFGVGQTIMKVVSDTIMEEGFAHPTYWYWYQLETSAPVVFFRHFRIGAQRTHEGRYGRGINANLYINKVRFCTFYACKGWKECVLVLCFDKQCGWLSNGYTEDVAPPYHVAMTVNQIDVLHGHKSPPLKSVERMISSDDNFISTCTGS
jgi:hypothetical protein